jgi:hypothetical protein
LDLSDARLLKKGYPVRLENQPFNILNQPLTGGEPTQLTKFDSGTIFDFHWSLGGTRLLMARGQASSDAALLSNLR